MMSDKTLAESMETFAVRKALNYLNEDPDQAFPNMFLALD